MENKLLNKLYLGCGNDRLAGFLHSDISKFKNKNGDPDFLCDFSENIPVSDSELDLVYTKGTLDLLTFSKLKNALLHINRILKVGGIFRIVVFDFHKAIKSYLSGNILDSGDYGVGFKDLPVYCKNTSFVGRVLYPGRKYLFNFEIIQKMLIDAGFENVVEVSAGKTKHIHDGLVMDNLSCSESNKSSDSMFVECNKTSEPPSYSFESIELPEGKINRLMAKYFNLTISKWN